MGDPESMLQAVVLVNERLISMVQGQLFPEFGERLYGVLAPWCVQLRAPAEDLLRDCAPR